MKGNSAFLYNTKKGISIKEINFFDFQTFVLHSFFYPAYLKLLLCIPRSKRIIICPRGAFSTSNHYSIKKHIYAFIYFGLIRWRRLKTGIHFLTENEQYRSRFHLNYEFIAGNACSVNFTDITYSEQIIRDKYYSKNIVYIGRFSKHIKGLDYLIKSVMNQKNEILKCGFQFNLYGPETEDKIWLSKYIEENNLSFIHLHNEIYGAEKESVYKNAMFNILTSRSEGFPMTVLESCAFFTPQILSKGTNIQESMIEQNFGVVFSNTFLNHISGLSFVDYIILCRNAREFAMKHDYEIIGKKTLSFYENV